MNLNARDLREVLDSSDVLRRGTMKVFWIVMGVFLLLFCGPPLFFPNEVLREGEKITVLYTLILLVAGVVTGGMIGVVISGLIYREQAIKTLLEDLKPEFRKEVLGKPIARSADDEALPVEVETWTTRVIDGLEHFILKAVGQEEVFVYQKVDNKVYLALKRLRRHDLIALRMKRARTEPREFIGFDDVRLQLEYVANVQRLRLAAAA